MAVLPALSYMLWGLYTQKQIWWWWECWGWGGEWIGKWMQIVEPLNKDHFIVLYIKGGSSRQVILNTSGPWDRFNWLISSTGVTYKCIIKKKNMLFEISLLLLKMVHIVKFYVQLHQPLKNVYGTGAQITDSFGPRLKTACPWLLS